MKKNLAKGSVAFKDAKLKQQVLDAVRFVREIGAEAKLKTVLMTIDSSPVSVTFEVPTETKSKDE